MLTIVVLVYMLPLILLIQGVLKSSKGLTLTFVLGTLTIFTTIVRFITLKIGTGQENLVCKCDISTENKKNSLTTAQKTLSAFSK